MQQLTRAERKTELTAMNWDQMHEPAASLLIQPSPRTVFPTWQLVEPQWFPRSFVGVNPGDVVARQFLDLEGLCFA
jgi:hypothetical protein